MSRHGSRAASGAANTIAFYGFSSAIYWALQNVKRALAGEVWRYRRIDFPLAATQQEQVAMVRQLCQELLEIMPRVAEPGGYVPENPMEVIEVWLSMASPG